MTNLITSLSTDCEQMEYCTDRFDDVLPRGCGQHSRVAGPASQVWEQDPDPYQDRS